jgi:hypothetical protein
MPRKTRVREHSRKNAARVREHERTLSDDPRDIHMQPTPGLVTSTIAFPPEWEPDHNGPHDTLAADDFHVLPGEWDDGEGGEAVEYVAHLRPAHRPDGISYATIIGHIDGTWHIEAGLERDDGEVSDMLAVGYNSHVDALREWKTRAWLERAQEVG